MKEIVAAIKKTELGSQLSTGTIRNYILDSCKSKKDKARLESESNAESTESKKTE